MRIASRESGQLIPIAALAMAAILGFASMTVDVGLWFHSKQDVQNAADAAALAAAGQMADDSTETVSVARQFATKNGYTDSIDGAVVIVDYPYQGDTTKVRIAISAPASIVFGPVLGIGDVTVSGSAVGQSVGTGPSYALYANGSACNKDIDWTGSSVNMTGDVHTNGQFAQSGGSNQISGAVTDGCGDRVSGTGNTYGSGPEIAPAREWPVTFTWDQLAGASHQNCLVYSTGNLTVGSQASHWQNNDSSTKILKPGVYCAEGTLSFTTSGVTGNVTFVARAKVTVSGGTFNVTPYSNGVFVYTEAVPNNAVNISGSNSHWQGIIYAPNGDAVVSGSGNGVLAGSVVANKIKLSGSNWSLQAGGGVGQNSKPRLIQ